ncbi:MAG: methyltransferase domain-containing protein [Desulfovibrionaceae bacterium]
MIYCFDIDGTLCTNTNGAYETAEPFPDMIARVTALYDAGHTIKLFTARGTVTGIDWRELTESQMRAWGLKYHELILGKPEADVFVDDKTINALDWRALPGLDASADAGFVARGGAGERNGAQEREGMAEADAGPGAAGAQPSACRGSALEDGAYLKVTYSQERAPVGAYPDQLAGHIAATAFGRPGRLLDIGCGRGDFLAAFSRLGYDVCGVDISPSAPAMCKGYHVETVDLEAGGGDAACAGGGFDFVFSKSVIEHLRTPMNLVRAAYDALAPGGVCVLMTPSWRHNAWGPFYVDHTHVSPFTAVSLADAMDMAGFQGVDVRHFRQLPRLWQRPWLEPASRLLALLPLPYRPFSPSAPWPDTVNKIIRFSKEVMLLGVGRKPLANGGT